MPRSRRAACQVCDDVESKYTCSACRIVYCSVACYRTHKEFSCTPTQHRDAPAPPALDDTATRVDAAADASTTPAPSAGDAIPDPTPLRPLTSLRWPYVPDAPAYPDPLARDDPKPLQLPQYEAIATSARVRAALAAHPRLPALLTEIDALRGPERERALERALGVGAPVVGEPARPVEVGEDVLALRALAEAVEMAVRAGDTRALGLDWDE